VSMGQIVSCSDVNILVVFGLLKLPYLKHFVLFHFFLVCFVLFCCVLWLYRYLHHICIIVLYLSYTSQISVNQQQHLHYITNEGCGVRNGSSKGS
jgi:hypothetical protein